MDEQLLDRIVLDPEVMRGKPIIRGTRIPVDMLIRMLAEGITVNEILWEYPNLTLDDIRAALEYAPQVGTIS